MDDRSDPLSTDETLTHAQNAKQGRQTKISKSLFGDAVALWKMSNLKDTAGKNSVLTLNGDVKVGIKLTEAEYDASIKRGGDGYVAEFQGGYLNAEQGAGGELNLTGKAMTLCIRLKDPSGKWNAPIFSKNGGSSKLVYRLIATDAGSGMALVFELGTDSDERPLQLNIPISILGSTSWHDVIVRYDNCKLELFVDGVLVDEEWPIGSLRQGNTAPCMIGAESCDDKINAGFYGFIDHVVLWKRALSNDEIILFSGGQQEVTIREKEILGEETPITQYWEPRGYNTNVGDCMPFYHDGLFHLYYLFDRRHHRSKWGFGAHQWAHASTPDLIHWTHHPIALQITEEHEGSICTGSVMFHQGMYYAYYATRIPGIGECLSFATSINGINFTKAKPNPFALPEPPYRQGPFRDPAVFYDKQTGLFNLLVTAELEIPDLAGRGGCLAHLTSPDLKNWELKEPFIIPGHIGQPECSDYFFWNDWYYLIFSIHGVARYRMSRNPFGAWLKPKADIFDGLQARVLKTSAFKDGRRIGVAFLPDNGYGGCVVFREIVQFEDGALGTRFPDELIPPSENSLRLQFEALTEGVFGDGSSIKINAVDSFEAAALLEVPQNAHIKLRINPDPGSFYFGVCLRGIGNYRDGHELRFEPYRQKVELRKPDSNHTDENKFSSIYVVDGLDKPFDLSIIAKDNIIDVCIDNRRTFVSRVSKMDGDKLFFFAQYARVDFGSIEIRPLL